MTLAESVVQWPCGCAGLDIQNGPGDYFVLMACGKHREEHAHWQDFYQETFKHVDAGFALCILDGAAMLIGDGWKFRAVQDLLGGSPMSKQFAVSLK